MIYNTSDSKFRGEIWEDGLAQAISGLAVSTPLPSAFKCAFSVGPNIYDYVQDGVAYGHDETVNFVPPTRAAIWYDGAAVPSRMRVSHVALYPFAMTAAQLEGGLTA